MTVSDTTTTTSTSPLPNRITASDLNWPHVLLLTITPIISLIGIATVPLQFKTLVWSIFYYYFTGLGITVGYHRYWSHRSYEATRPFQVVMALAGAGAVQGSIRWWSRGHRAHHRYTDHPTKDPYSAANGLFWSHIGWLIMRTDYAKIGRVDISDLNRDPVVMWQHKYYLPIAISMSVIVPTLVAGLGWGDWYGGYIYAGILRLVIVHHATFCVNSLAHWVGSPTFDDRHSPRDHIFTAIVTFGEGYHNFHHEFPSDYRNALHPMQYDPSKWIIWICSLPGITYNLTTFPHNEIEKGRITMIEKHLAHRKRVLKYGTPVHQLPRFTKHDIQRKCDAGQCLIIINNIVHDVTDFIEAHPGGRAFLTTSIGKDVTREFNGGVYDHHNAARNLAEMMRIGVVVDNDCDAVGTGDACRDMVDGAGFGTIDTKEE